MVAPYAAASLPFLLLFRLTCYYYRGAYYRSVWQSPTACAVAEPHAKYTGETRFPLIIQNTHRYFFYTAAIIGSINTYDAIVAFHSPTGFGFGLGNIILLVNVVMLSITARRSTTRLGSRASSFLPSPSAVPRSSRRAAPRRRRPRASATIDAARDWLHGTPEGDWASMAVVSDGSYGIPEGLIYSYPVTTSGGDWTIVQGLEIDEFSRARMDATAAELIEERDAVKELGLI